MIPVQKGGLSPLLVRPRINCGNIAAIASSSSAITSASVIARSVSAAGEDAAGGGNVSTLHVERAALEAVAPDGADEAGVVDAVDVVDVGSAARMCR